MDLAHFYKIVPDRPSIIKSGGSENDSFYRLKNERISEFSLHMKLRNWLIIVLNCFQDKLKLNFDFCENRKQKSDFDFFHFSLQIEIISREVAKSHSFSFRKCKDRE